MAGWLWAKNLLLSRRVTDRRYSSLKFACSMYANSQSTSVSVAPVPRGTELVSSDRCKIKNPLKKKLHNENENYQLIISSFKLSTQTHLIDLQSLLTVSNHFPFQSKFVLENASGLHSQQANYRQG